MKENEMIMQFLTITLNQERNHCCIQRPGFSIFIPLFEVFSHFLAMAEDDFRGILEITKHARWIQL